MDHVASTGVAFFDQLGDGAGADEGNVIGMRLNRGEDLALVRLAGLRFLDGIGAPAGAWDPA